MLNHHVMARLRKILANALDNDVETEAANALAAVKRWMTRNAKDADWVLANINMQEPLAPMVLDDWRVHRDYLHEHQGLLNDRELDFVLDCVRKGDRWNATPKRVNWLRSCYMRVQLIAGLNPV